MSFLAGLPGLIGSLFVLGICSWVGGLWPSDFAIRGSWALRFYRQSSLNSKPLNQTLNPKPGSVRKFDSDG